MIASPLRDRIREHLQREVLEGRVAPGEQIRVAPLAERFSVSLTPAREALTQLEAEGWLVLRPNRGFFVAPISVEEAEAMYPLIAALEALAVELQEPPARELVERLESINAEMKETTNDSTRAFRCDRRWHEALTSKCGNPLLLNHLESLRLRAECYERAYMRHSGRVPTSTDDHERIARELGSGSRRRVRRLLEEHWNRSLEFERDWLGERLDLAAPGSL